MNFGQFSHRLFFGLERSNISLVQSIWLAVLESIHEFTFNLPRLCSLAKQFPTCLIQILQMTSTVNGESWIYNESFCGTRRAWLFPPRRVSAVSQCVLRGNSTYSQLQLESRGCWQHRYHKPNYFTCLSKFHTARYRAWTKYCLVWRERHLFFHAKKTVIWLLWHAAFKRVDVKTNSGSQTRLSVSLVV